MTKDEALKLALSALNEVRQETFHAEKKVWMAIYTIKKVLAQPKQDTWVGLTDEEIDHIAKNYALNNPTTPLHFARAIEAKLKDKNT